MRPRIVLLLMLCALPALVGCGGKTPPPPRDVVYVCTESKEEFYLPAATPPPVNPKTGQATLVAGMYCDQCKKWYAVPPAEIIGGNQAALKCPVHKTTKLVQEGPPPE